MDAWVIWLVVGVLFLFAELFTPELVLGSLGLACMAAGAAAYAGVSVTWQLVAFIAASLLLMLAVRPRLKRMLYRNAEPLAAGAAGLVDRTGIVVEPVGDETRPGRVKLGGEEWRAVTCGEATIEAGAHVVVTGVDAATLSVKPHPERGEKQ